MHLDSIYFQAGEITDFEGGDDVATNQFKSLNKIYFWKIWQIISLQENKSLNKIKNTIIHPQLKKKLLYILYIITLWKNLSLLQIVFGRFQATTMGYVRYTEIQLLELGQWPCRERNAQTLSN